jgi:hypothetical protein
MGSGREPGRDIGLVHLDAQKVSDWAAVDQRFADVGSACADLVIGQIHCGERGIPAIPKTVTLATIWRDGPTVCAPLGHAAKH